MEVSIGIYEEIMGEGEAPPPVDEADYERRKHRRVPFGHRATITVERKGGDNTPTVVVVRDLSVAGVSFMHEETLKPGTPLTIEFKGYEERPVKLRCAVARCETGGSAGAQFVVGATFEELLTKYPPPKKAADPPKLAEAAPAEAKHPEVKLADAKPAKPPLVEAKHAEPKQPEQKPAVARQPEPRPAPVKPPEPRPVVAKPPELKSAVAKPPDLKPATPAPVVEPEPDAPIPIELVPVEAEPAPVATTLTPAAHAKSSALFKAADPSEAGKEPKEEYWAEGEPAIPQAAAASKTDETDAAPVFRDVPLPPAEMKAEVVSYVEPEEEPEPEPGSEIGMPDEPKPEPEPEPEPEPKQRVVVPIQPERPASDHHAKSQEVLTRVKQLLVKQEQSLERQRQELKSQRERFEKEVKAMRAELDGANTKLAEIRARYDEDEDAIAELESFLSQHDRTDPPAKKNEAA